MGQQILDKLAEEFPTSSFGFPSIGCGLAGGDKRRILDTIDNFSKLIEGSVTIVKWNK